VKDPSRLFLLDEFADHWPPREAVVGRLQQVVFDLEQDLLASGIITYRAEDDGEAE